MLLLHGGFCSLGTTCPQAEALAGSLRVHVVGHSDGAVIGLLLALRHPARGQLTALACATPPSQARLGFGVRTKVCRSTSTRPKVGP